MNKAGRKNPKLRAMLRTLAYVGLAVLALVAIALVVYLTTTPGWDAPLRAPDLGTGK